MTDHRFHACNEERCNVCDGGLTLCDVCGGAEGALPQDCPGERMSGDLLDAIGGGRADYRHGAWVDLRAPGVTFVVAAVAVRRGKVLLIRSRKHGVALPAGKAKMGECEADALAREVREETGLTVTRVGRYLGADIQPTFRCNHYEVEVSDEEPVGGSDAESAWWGEPDELLSSVFPTDRGYAIRLIEEEQR